MPNIEFSISGEGASEIVLKAALEWGYQEMISDPENEGEMIPNPQTAVEYNIQRFFKQLCDAAVTYQKRTGYDEVDAEVEGMTESVVLSM